MQQLMDALPIRYNIAMLAPPWIPVPPDGYGGTEQVVALLCEGLVGRATESTCSQRPDHALPPPSMRYYPNPIRTRSESRSTRAITLPGPSVPLTR
jgi:hypothetical protein